MTERIAIVGGTFDPIHNGHLVAATSARDQLGCDRTLVVVAGAPWQKTEIGITPAAERFEMAQLAFAAVDGVEVSDLELQREGPTYTIDTVIELASPDREIYLVLGTDAVHGLESWSRASDLAQLVTIAALSRNGEGQPVPHERWSIVSVVMPRLDISSTEIRSRVEQQRSICGLTPPAVCEYIERRRLYQ